MLTPEAAQPQGITVLFDLVTGSLLATAGYLFKGTWDEIKQLRARSHEHATKISEHSMEIEMLREDVNFLRERSHG